ncbi:hypothetical protein PRIPAC_98083 [Pristionchus pacificus]|uniref:Uncharacterized protein n=1 Tax=Pristionchus pacificus TaxID=54126 RepID=A0A2A6D2K8_PRIPA|nr:hypothetical protein PRIPAC_98083 [Pristionchus pacificus]|eukprot:PDM84521.1 hypothetical protein PRIPAC_33544 [Pristionchus pacificus]
MPFQVVSAIQPLQSGRITRKVNEGDGHSWAPYWTHLGLVELEAVLSKTAGTYCVRDSVSIADTCVPSVVYKGRTFGLDVAEFRTLLRIEDNLKALKPLISAFPFDSVVSAIQPLQSGRITRKVNEGDGHSVSQCLGTSRRAQLQWAPYWTHLGLVELEAVLSKTAGTYCVRDSVSIADTCVPSVVYKGRTFGLDVAEFRTLLRIEDNLKALKPLISAFPFDSVNDLKHSIN